jgi:hypothetical protein
MSLAKQILETRCLVEVVNDVKLTFGGNRSEEGPSKATGGASDLRCQSVAAAGTSDYVSYDGCANSMQARCERHRTRCYQIVANWK